MFLNELGEALPGVSQVIPGDVDMGLFPFSRKAQRCQGAPGNVFVDGENHCAVRVSHVPFSAHDVAAVRRFFEDIALRKRSVFREAALGAPAVVRDIVV